MPAAESMRCAASAPLMRDDPATWLHLPNALLTRICAHSASSIVGPTRIKYSGSKNIEASWPSAARLPRAGSRAAFRLAGFAVYPGTPGFGDGSSPGPGTATPGAESDSGRRAPPGSDQTISILRGWAATVLGRCNVSNPCASSARMPSRFTFLPSRNVRSKFPTP